MKSIVYFVPGGGIKNGKPDENLQQRCECTFQLLPMRGSCFVERGNPYVCVTGGIVYPGEMLSESEVMKLYFLEKNVPENRILVGGGVDSVSNVVQTWGKYRELLFPPDTTIVIVSQWPHALRLWQTFRALGKKEVQIEACPYGNWRQALRAYLWYEPIAWLVFGLDPLGTGFLARYLARSRCKNFAPKTVG